MKINWQIVHDYIGIMNINIQQDVSDSSLIQLWFIDLKQKSSNENENLTQKLT